MSFLRLLTTRPHVAVRALLLAAAVAAVSAACSSSPAAPAVSGAWVRAPMGSAPVAAYFVINNGTGQDDALTAVSSPAASSVEIHQTETDMAGMTGMAPVSRVDVKAGSTVSFAPGGFHVMLSGLKSALTVGDTVELDLTFERAGRVVVQAEVKQG